MDKLSELRKYLDYEFSTGVCTGEDYKKFQNKYINYLRSICKERGWEVVNVGRGHYYFSLFIKENDNYIYLAIHDVRYNQVSGELIGLLKTMVQNLLNNMLFKGYALATVRKIKFVLNQFFAYAVQAGMISKNPMEFCVVKATEAHKEIKQEKYKAIPERLRPYFLEVIKKSEVLYPICMVQLFAGLRIGEVLALKWKDIDLILDVITVDNAVTIDMTFDDKGNVLEQKTIISDTKTAASVREVPIPPILKECLTDWKRIRTGRQVATRKSFVDAEDLVFSTNNGELRSYHATRKMFDKLMKKNGLDKYHFHFHSLRHTYSTMLWESSENPKVIQMLLGHKDVTTTIKTYNSVDRSYFKQATDKLEAKFRQTPQ